MLFLQSEYINPLCLMVDSGRPRRKFSPEDLAMIARDVREAGHQKPATVVQAKGVSAAANAGANRRPSLVDDDQAEDVADQLFGMLDDDVAKPFIRDIYQEPPVSEDELVERLADMAGPGRVGAGSRAPADDEPDNLVTELHNLALEPSPGRSLQSRDVAMGEPATGDPDDDEMVDKLYEMGKGD